MFEFARANWLWLFLLTLLFFVAYVLARRFRATRATYGQVWHALARKMRPPAWKRILRTLLTWLIALALIASVVLYAAGMQRPQAERPPALMIAIVLDCTPSMTARQRATTRTTLAWQRTRDILRAMSPEDRAVLFHFENGTPVGSRWLSAEDVPEGPPPVDFAQPDLSALAAAVNALQPPPGMPADPQPARFIWWLGDKAPAGQAGQPPSGLGGLGGIWRTMHGIPALVETFGGATTNDAITSARWIPAQDGLLRGALEFETRSGESVKLTGSRAGHVSLRQPAQRFEIATTDESTDFEANTGREDALREDDNVSFALPPPPLVRAHLAWPAADGEFNPELFKALGLLLPGVALTTGSTAELPRHELLICDRFVPAGASARFMLCFGVLPSKFGATGTPIRVAPGLQRAERPEGLGFEVPDLAMLYGDEVAPLARSTGLRPLLKSPAGDVLIAEGMVDGTRMLYSGFAPHQSMLLEEAGGLLLLIRWLDAIRAGTPPPWPPVLRTGATHEARVEPLAAFEVFLESTPWADCAGERKFTMTAGADGRVVLGPLAIPGRWAVRDAAGNTARVTALWRDPFEQALAFEAAPPASLADLRPTPLPDWRDHLPAALLWLALALLVLEWILWLVGITE